MKSTDARIVLTGAAGGIGSAIARRLAASGATLLLTDLRQEPLDRLAAELGAAAPRALATDIATDDGRAMLAAAAREHGANVLINAAGVNPFGLFAEQAASDIGRAFAINALAPIMLCHALLPVLRERPSAHIVNLGSTFGSIGFPGFAAYSASKFAVRGFSEALRRELADTGVRVHYVAPRATATALATDRVRAMNAELGVGMDSAQTVAEAVERVLREGRNELLLGKPERLFAKLNALLPTLVDRSLRRQLPIIRRYASLSRDQPGARRASTPPVNTLRSIES